MKKCIPQVVVIVSLLLAPPVSAGSRESPEITDPAGDANASDSVVPGGVSTGPASAGWADLTRVWFSTDFAAVPAQQDGQEGLRKVPQRLRVSFETAAPIEPVGPGIAYVAEWRVNNCRYRVIVHVPGAYRDSAKALLYSECGPSSVTLDLAPPSIQGAVASAAVDLGSDAFLRLYDGDSLGAIRAFTAPYHDWYLDYRFGATPPAAIDIAPSSGAAGYFEIGSDLDPRFVPGPAPAPGALVTAAGGSNGDGLPADQASILEPWAVSVGPDGLVYIADYWHHRVRRVAADGTMQPYAGLIAGFAGDGGHRLLASIRGPAGMDWAPDGTLYFADSLNHRVRAVGPDGTIRRIAGDGVRRLAGDGGPARQASLSWPQDVAVSASGDIFIADLENGRVRRVDAETGTISTYAGGGVTVQEGVPGTESSLSPNGLAIDPEGDLWVSERSRVREIDAATGVIETRVSGFTEARGIAFDLNGDLLIADASAYQVLRWSESGGTSLVAGSGSTAGLGDGGPATEASLHHAVDVDVDAEGNIYIAERHILDQRQTNPVGHHRIRVVRPDDTIETVAGSGDDRSRFPQGSPGLGVDFQEIKGIAYDDEGRLYIADGPSAGTLTPGSRSGGGLLYRMDLDGSVRVVAGNGELGDPAVDDDDGAALEVPLGHPIGIDVGPDGLVYIADVQNRRIKAYDPVAGTITSVAGVSSSTIAGGAQPDQVPALAANLYFPRALAVGSNGDVYWTEASYLGCNPSRIRMLRDGIVHLVAGTRDTTQAYPCGFSGDRQPAGDATRLAVPEGLAIDVDGSLLIADSQNARVRRIGVDGVVETVLGDGAREHRDGTIADLASFAHPVDVEATGDGGYLVAEQGIASLGLRGLHTGPRVSYVAPNGMVSTVAGTGVFDITMDSEPLATPLVSPNALALGPAGTLAIADYHRVRILAPPEGGWPQPERSPACLPSLPDTSGDARARMTLNTHSTNNPSIDLRGAEADTSGADLVATISLEDLDPVWASVPDDRSVSYIWAYVWWDGETQNTRYLAAINPVSQDEPLAGGFSFEWGDLTGGTAESVTFTRRGAASGAVDFEADTVTLRAPKAVVGLADGEIVQFQSGVTGGLTQAGASKFSVYADTSPWSSSYRSYEVGRVCPEGFGP